MKQKTKKNCRQCKGEICIHEDLEKKDDNTVVIPNIAEQTMSILENLLKERENNPEEILKLATTGELFQLGMDPFCITAAMGHPEGMRRFLEAGKDPNERCSADGNTPLILATQNRHCNVVEILLSHGADITLENAEGSNALMLAIGTGDAKLVNTMWQYREKLNINHQNRKGQTALHFAAERCWDVCVQFLINHGADVNIQNNIGWTPLMISAMKSDLKTADKLLNAGADILLEDNYSYTAIGWGTDEAKKDEFAKYLLSKMSNKDRETYVKNRIERIKNPVENCDFDDFFDDIVVSIFYHLSKIDHGRDILYRQKLIPNLLSVAQTHMRKHDIVSGSCNIFCSCMYQKPMTIEERFAKQFIQARGPDFCLKALKTYPDTGKKEMEFRICCLFPIVCASLYKNSKEWIEKNSNRISQHANLREKFEEVKYEDESLRQNGLTLWRRFWDDIDTMQTNQREIKMKELLEEEERERARKIKKRERKKQKRQREKLNKAGNRVEKSFVNDIVQAEEEVSESRKSVENVCDQTMTENCQPELPEENDICKTLIVAKGDLDSVQSQHITMNKSTNSKTRKKSKVKKIKKKDKGEDIIEKTTNETNVIISVKNKTNDEFSAETADGNDSWQTVQGKKSQSKLDCRVTESKRPKKKKRDEKRNVNVLNNSEPRTLGECVTKTVASKEQKIRKASHVESVEKTVDTTDQIQFPSLEATSHLVNELIMKTPGPLSPDSTISTCNNLDSDDFSDMALYVQSIENLDDEMPVWAESSNQNISETDSDIYWMATETFEQNVRMNVSEKNTENIATINTYYKEKEEKSWEVNDVEYTVHISETELNSHNCMDAEYITNDSMRKEISSKFKKKSRLTKPQRECVDMRSCGHTLKEASDLVFLSECNEVVLHNTEPTDSKNCNIIKKDVKNNGKKYAVQLTESSNHRYSRIYEDDAKNDIQKSGESVMTLKDIAQSLIQDNQTVCIETENENENKNVSSCHMTRDDKIQPVEKLDQLESIKTDNKTIGTKQGIHKENVPTEGSCSNKTHNLQLQDTNLEKSYPELPKRKTETDLSYGQAVCNCQHLNMRKGEDENKCNEGSVAIYETETMQPFRFPCQNAFNDVPVTEGDKIIDSMHVEDPCKRMPVNNVNSCGADKINLHLPTTLTPFDHAITNKYETHNDTRNETIKKKHFTVTELEAEFLRDSKYVNETKENINQKIAIIQPIGHGTHLVGVKREQHEGMMNSFPATTLRMQRIENTTNLQYPEVDVHPVGRPYQNNTHIRNSSPLVSYPNSVQRESYETTQYSYNGKTDFNTSYSHRLKRNTNQLPDQNIIGNGDVQKQRHFDKYVQYHRIRDDTLAQNITTASNTDNSPMGEGVSRRIREDIEPLTMHDVSNLEIIPLGERMNTAITSDTGNCALGESILQNALNLKHVDHEVAYPSELCERDGDVVDSFPGFHDSNTSDIDEARIIMNRHKLELIQFIQLQNYFHQYCSTANTMNSAYYNNFQYYASALGLSRDEVEKITGIKGKTTSETLKSAATGGEFARKDDIQNKSVNPNIHSEGENVYNVEAKSKESERISFHDQTQRNGYQTVRKEFNGILREHVNENSLSNNFAVNHMEVTENSTAIKNWQKKSSRWRLRIKEIVEMSNVQRQRIGDIIIPIDRDRYRISYSDEGAILGFLSDGSEVAVHVVDLLKRPMDTGFLQTLVSNHFSHYFLVKYKSFAIEKNTCYLAMELQEYTLTEYTSMLRLNQGVDPLTVNRLTWQLLKGLASLHENCGIPHGNIMPSNILVDTEGRLRLSEYGFPRLAQHNDQLLTSMSIAEDRACWTPTEVVTETGLYTIKSDIQVVAMLIFYILSGGKHAYGENRLEITISIQANWPKLSNNDDEIDDLLSQMMNMPPELRPEVSDILKHPYFWADEKRLRFVIIAGSDVLRDMKVGIPISGGVGGRISMIDILNTANYDVSVNDWTSTVDPVIMKEMRSFRQYKNTLVELVLFVYNCCLHFEKLSSQAREILDEPCKYFLTMFPRLFMAVFRAIKASDRKEKICYKPFF